MDKIKKLLELIVREAKFLKTNTKITIFPKGNYSVPGEEYLSVKMRREAYWTMDRI